MNSLSEELSLMLSCLRESQLETTQRVQTRAPHDTESSSARRHVSNDDVIVRRRYDVCFTRAEWRMTEQDGQIGIADLLLANFLYTKLNYDNDSGYHQLELGAFKVHSPASTFLSKVKRLHVYMKTVLVFIGCKNIMNTVK